MGRRKITYKEVLEGNIERISKFYQTEYYKYLKDSKLDLIKKVVTEALYVDPDAKMEITIQVDEKDMILSADGIVSVKKLYNLFDGKNGVQWIEEYSIIRNEKYVCFYWPKHRGGINSCKATVFDDRVDYTLYDIKIFYEIIKKYGGDEKRIKEQIEKNCKLGTAFIKDKTYGWLCAFNSFSNFIISRGLEKFVDSEFEVIDLETDKPISGYKEGKNAYDWGMNYYENLKMKLLKC